MDARLGFHRAMTIELKKPLFALSALLLLGASVVMSQQKQAAVDGPRLYRVWSDAKGETHLEEINIATKGRATIPGIVMNFSGVVTGPGGTRGGEQLHNTRRASVRGHCLWAKSMSKPATGPGRTCGPAT